MNFKIRKTRLLATHLVHGRRLTVQSWPIPIDPDEVRLGLAASDRQHFERWLLKHPEVHSGRLPVSRASGIAPVYVDSIIVLYQAIAGQVRALLSQPNLSIRVRLHLQSIHRNLSASMPDDIIDPTETIAIIEQADESDDGCAPGAA